MKISLCAEYGICPMAESTALSNFGIFNVCLKEMDVSQDFTERLKYAFDQASMAEVARQLGVPHATVRNYYRGRMPAPEVLIKIANQTHVSLNWLLAGTGPMYLSDAGPPSFDRFLNDRIAEIIDQKLAERGMAKPIELGRLDAGPHFDIHSSVDQYGDPHRVLSEWFNHEGREYPSDFGVAFFQGWESFTRDEKVDAIRDAKKVLDRTLSKK